MQLSRRGLLGGMLALVAAPAIVRVESLMPVRQHIIPAVAQLPFEVDPAVLQLGGRSLFTINMITREAVRLWTESNVFLKSIDEQYAHEFATENARIGSKLRITVPKDFVLTRESAIGLTALMVEARKATCSTG